MHSHASACIHAHSRASAPQFYSCLALIHWLRVFTSAAVNPVDIASEIRWIIARSSCVVDFAGYDDSKCPQAQLKPAAQLLAAWGCALNMLL